MVGFLDRGRNQSSELLKTNLGLILRLVWDRFQGGLDGLLRPIVWTVLWASFVP